MKKTRYRNNYSKSAEIDNVMKLIIGSVSVAFVIRIILFFAFKI